MRLVVALGGNALLERGEVPASERLAAHVAAAAEALAPLARDHELVVTHGNGPQVGLLARESADDPELPDPYPLDVLGAETQGMVGYLLARDLGNRSGGRPVVSLVTQTVVDADDPAFGRPTKFVGPTYDRERAAEVATARGWTVAPDGDRWRRVVAAPEPHRIVELPAVRHLLGAGTVVVCAGGGGVPVTADASGTLSGAAAVIDKDLSSALLARDLQADALLILTDVDGVIDGFGGPHPRLVPAASPESLRAMVLPDGSMGPKAEAACRFTETTGRFAAIGRLGDAVDVLAGRAGTMVRPGGGPRDHPGARRFTQPVGNPGGDGRG